MGGEESTMIEGALLKESQYECEKAAETPVRIEMCVGQAFLIVTTMQLAYQHPEVQGETAEDIRAIGNEIQNMLGTVCGPATLEILRQGWK
jgi:hypothetical protein